MAKLRFQDDNFRMACIDILLDRGHFEEELAEILEIPEYEDGYEVNPVRMKAFRNLPITQEHLDEITSFAPDGGDDIYFRVLPQWSGEEECLYIRNFDDLKYLRNLESIHIYSVAEQGAFDLSLLLPLQKLKAVFTDYFYLSPDCDIKATVAELKRRGVAVEIQGRPD
jgi:hypothetical protein